MAQVLRRGARVGQFITIELAGDGTQSNVYFARREHQAFWLIQIEVPTFEPKLLNLLSETFQVDDEKWVAVPVSGTTVVNLASWVDHFDLGFIGWRWVQLARSVGFSHQKGVIVQQSRVFSLDRLVFTSDGELILSEGSNKQADAYPFPPPESASALTPASDVYSLGASLASLTDEKTSRRVQGVLKNATNPDPSKRFGNGLEFANALVDVLPAPARSKRERDPLPRWAWWVVAAIAIMLAMYATIGYLVVNELPKWK